jgi:hypothetical protein
MNLYLDLEKYQEIIDKKSYSEDGMCLVFIYIKKPDVPYVRIKLKTITIEKRHDHERKFSKARHKLNLTKAALHELFTAVKW